MSQHAPAPAGRTRPVRIGDAERDHAVTMLSEHFVAGRLTQDEFEERSDQATRARYADDLTPLFDDLPDATAARPGQPAWSPGYRSGPPRFRPGRPFLWPVPLLVVGVVIAAILLTAPWILWGLFWIALFTGLHNHRHGFSGLAGTSRCRRTSSSSSRPS